MLRTSPAPPARGLLQLPALALAVKAGVPASPKKLSHMASSPAPPVRALLHLPALALAVKLGVPASTKKLSFRASSPAPPVRALLHLPALVLAAKAGALASTRKLALSALLRRVGVSNVIRGLRDANSRLHATQPALHPQRAFDSVEERLTQLEKGLRGAQESDLVRMAFESLDNLEKDNRFISLVLRTYLDGQAPVKWANALFRPPPK